MRIKLSQDQNTLEIDGVIFQANQTGYDLDGCSICDGCFFDNKNCSSFLDVAFCVELHRDDKQDIVWVKKI